VYSTRLMMTLMTPGENPRPTGFVLLDPVKQTSTVVDTPDEEKGNAQYAWLPDGTGVAVGQESATGFGIIYRDLTGRQTADFNWVGESYGRRMFSPSGHQFITFCPSGGTLCLWDSKSGVRQASISIFFEGAVLIGWWDDTHLVVIDPSRKRHEVVVMDTRGRQQRVLADIAAKDDKDDLFFYYTRS
jgi:eukaryotic-like serine/threonine-protein kinase